VVVVVVVAVVIGTEGTGDNCHHTTVSHTAKSVTSAMQLEQMFRGHIGAHERVGIHLPTGRLSTQNQAKSEHDQHCV